MLIDQIGNELNNTDIWAYERDKKAALQERHFLLSYGTDDNNAFHITDLVQ